MQYLIPNLVSQEQGDFVLGKETMEGAIVSHEALHSINTSSLSNFIIKLDMMKAYDKICWEFLFKVLHKFRFSKNWFKWIRACISGAWFSVSLMES